MVQVEMECDGKWDCLRLEGVSGGGDAAVGAGHSSFINLVLLVHRTTSRHALCARLIGSQLNNNTGRLVLKLKKVSPIRSTSLNFWFYIYLLLYSTLGFFKSHLSKCPHYLKQNSTQAKRTFNGSFFHALSDGVINFFCEC